MPKQSSVTLSWKGWVVLQSLDSTVEILKYEPLPHISAAEPPFPSSAIFYLLQLMSYQVIRAMQIKLLHLKLLSYNRSLSAHQRSYQIFAPSSGNAGKYLLAERWRKNQNIFKIYNVRAFSFLDSSQNFQLLSLMPHISAFCMLFNH